MRIDEEERDIVSQFFAMLGDKGWRHATHSNGTSRAVWKTYLVPTNSTALPERSFTNYVV